MAEQNDKIEKSNKKFFKKIANYYDGGLIGKILFKRTNNILKLSKVKKHSKILDVGCGTGNLLSLLSRDKTLTLYGIDLSKEMLRIAKNKLLKNAHLSLGSVNYLLKNYGQDYFDYIFFDDVFHHLPNQEEVVKDVLVLLKDNGKFIISDLSFGRFGNTIFHKLEPGNSRMYTATDYIALFKENRFEKIKQKRMGLVSIYTEGVKTGEEK